MKTNILAARYLPGLLLIGAIFLLYGHALWNPLVFDDKPFFDEATLRQYGTSLFHLDLRWFSYASFGWTYDAVGTDWVWYRFGNLALHAATAILLYVFIRRLLSAVWKDEAHPSHWAAFFAALAFALHPVAVYGVAYLVERSIVMATLFGIAALLCYLEGLTRNNKKWFAGSAALYFLAVFSKEHSVLIPGAAAALTLLLEKPSLALAKRLWLPFALYAAIGILITLRAQGVLGTPYEPFAAEMLSRMSEGQAPGAAQSGGAYLASVVTEGSLFFKYLLLWIVPYTGWMSVDLRQPFGASSPLELAGFALFLAYPVLAVWLLLKRGRAGLAGFGLLFPWILYLTELSTVRVQEPFVLYRSYLWMSGLFAVVPALAPALPRKLAPYVLAALCLLLAALAWNRLDTFSSELKLWSDAVAKNGDEKLLGVDRAYNNRGTAYMMANQPQAAREDFKKAIALNPKYPEPYVNIGMLEQKERHFEAALQSYGAALALDPADVNAYLNRGFVYLQTGRLAEALGDFGRILQIDPRNELAYLNLGIAYSRMGKAGEADNAFDEALHIDPGFAAAYMNRGIADAATGHWDSALDDMNHAIRLSPDYAEGYFNRGIVYGATGHYPEAMRDYDKAISLAPDYADAYINRGGLYMLAGRLPEALAEFDHAIRIDPSQVNAYLNRASIYAGEARYQEALGDDDKALELDPGNGQALMNRGLVLLAMGRRAEAQDSFRRSCAAGNKAGCTRAH